MSSQNSSGFWSQNSIQIFSVEFGPRKKECTCLGDITRPKVAERMLDLYCRDKPYKIVPGDGNFIGGVDADANDTALNVALPSRTRCGTLDELDVSEENECACRDKDGAGATYGTWEAIQ